jgi:uncharacterized protein YndB with AHSA1/START domain
VTEASSSTSSTRAIEVDVTAAFTVPIERLWLALTQRTGSWWGPPWVREPDRSIGVQLEERPGGLLWEDWGPGEGALLGKVSAIARPRLLIIDGPLFVLGAVAGEAVLSLTATEGGSQLHVRHVAVGTIPDDGADRTAGAWTDLLGRLRAQVQPSA